MPRPTPAGPITELSPPSATADPATHAQAIALLTAFRPRMGTRYANGRNHDLGVGAHTAVSGLSPFVRHRLVTERSLVAAALADHGAQDAERFIQEVFWRTYFKGWLEGRPAVWRAYVEGLEADLATLALDRRLRRAVEGAEAGATGLPYMDAWAEELVETGYLHNHARMWFASIWIFTLRLPWRVGADFFLRHLKDGDPASNTLGWRWVAGLHTVGRPYPATAANIRSFTGGRFDPRPGDLARDVVALTEAEPAPNARPPRALPPVDPRRATALLMTAEDCLPEEVVFGSGLVTPGDLRATATLAGHHLRSPRPVSDIVARFETGALADTAARIRGLGAPEATMLTAGSPGDLVRWAARAGATQIVTAYLPEGPLRDWLREAEPGLAQAGITLREVRRDWDSLIWPAATAGYSKVRNRIPEFLTASGL